MKKILVIGGSSGMGRGIAILFAKQGNMVAVAGRKADRLQSLQSLYPAIKTYMLDVTHDDVISNIQMIVHDLQGLDLMLISAGGGEPASELVWELDEQIVQLNVNAFVRMAHWAYQYFMQQGYGHLAAISSVAAIRGGSQAPAYNAAKAFQSNYLEGLSLKAAIQNKAVSVTCIEPGFVDTKPSRTHKIFWMVPVEKAAAQIVAGIEKKQRKIYISKRWGMIAWLLKWMPYTLYQKVMNR